MSAKATHGSKQTELLLMHDLKLVCSECSVKENEITYTLNSVHHQCAHNILICRAKGKSKWRPISRRPTLSNPSQYEVCWFFVEGSGCTKHKNRCTFARSNEEATVWNYEKVSQLDRLSLCNLVLHFESDPAQRNAAQHDKFESLDDLLPIVDLKVVCSLCCNKDTEIEYKILSVCHQCHRDLLLAKKKGCELWRPISEHPTKTGKFGSNVHFEVCSFYKEGSGCTKHGQECTFARSFEEATIWNFVRDKKLDNAKLIRLVTESQFNSLMPEKIIEEFSGEFLELCKVCFFSIPQKVTIKKWNNTCSADAAHTWEPILVHHLAENQGKHIYNQVRPFTQDCKLEYCSHVMQGKPCWHEPTKCHSAQSEVEMAVWKAEDSSGTSIRPELIQLSQEGERKPRTVTFYCRACLLVLYTKESFFTHCASLEHARIIAEDTTTKWKTRPPPHNRRAEFWLCERPDTCEYGEFCLKAHSVEELKEWLMRAKEEKEIRKNIDAQGLMPYCDKFLVEYQNHSNKEYIISEEVDDVSVTCDEELSVDCKETNARLQWHFQVNTERPLVHVALLKVEPGASFSIGENLSEPCTYSPGEQFQTTDITYSITVSFTSIIPGLYKQWLVFDFNMRPVLLRKLKVRVGHLSLTDIGEPTVNHATTSQSLERWHRGNRTIIPCMTRTEEQEELLKEYKPPQISFLPKPTNDSQKPLDVENYRERMHSFLFNEEQAEDQVVSRLSICGEVTMTPTLQSKQFLIEAPQGELFCTVSVPCNLTPDTPEGFVLRRSIQSALIAPLSSADKNHKVYEAIILQDIKSENQIHLQLLKRCCSDLSLKSNETHQMEVQFQMNRRTFCNMHKAVDLLPGTKNVLPDFSNCGIPVNKTQYDDNLNAKQQSAIDFIMGDSDERKIVAPLLIYGPFGTGKTFTLATAARELAHLPHNKVLICTLTNSSADLYVKDYFHPFINKGHHGIRPIRIKANRQGISFDATDDITLKYCLFSEERKQFLPATKAALDQHKIVITTTAITRHFHDLKLPTGYFTHILIDEASQMLECEALMPLGLVGPNTRVVLAGDHMQMGPKLFSVEDHQRSDHTLLNRLFHYYQSQRNDSAQKSRIIFNENYRSTQEIVQFVSTHFYLGKNDAIKAAGDIPGHPNDHSLKFHHVRGECQLDTISMTWFNREECAKVVEVVQDILQHWPSIWGTKDPSSICVLSEGCQVRQIRTALSQRIKGQNEVIVQNVANVQGKQFRAVILTTVQTRESLKSAHSSGLELFNDARVLNTTITRAQSQVVVVGDAAALCCFGKCSRIWKSYIDHCIHKKSVGPQYFTKYFFEIEIEEILRFQRSDHQDENSFRIDAILQELKDNDELETDCSPQEDRLEFPAEYKASYSIHDSQKNALLDLCKSQPNMYQQGTLVRESSSTGYVIPFGNPTKPIRLKGRKNMGNSFSGDEIVIQTKGSPEIKVIGVTKNSESDRTFVCTLEDEDYCKRKLTSEDRLYKMMIPITKNAPKITILLKRRHDLPVWENTEGEWTILTSQRIDEKLKQNNAFVVQVICWKEKCLFPLGKVIAIIPNGGSLSDALRILNEEFKPVPPLQESKKNWFWGVEKGMERVDLRDIITFTVDSAVAEALDDAISVRDIGDQYQVGVHIADVASYVRPGDTLDEHAKNLGATYYRRGNEPIRIFPQTLSSKQWSLLPGHDRKVVSLMFTVKKENNEITENPTFHLSLIKSNRKISYEEAEDIICKRFLKELKFDTVEDCVTVAYIFAKCQRKVRLVDWVYAQSDDQRIPGKRKAHLMIEELNVLFNKWAAEMLRKSGKTMDCTPLRCQAKPHGDKIKELTEMYRELIPLSFHLRHRVETEHVIPDHDGLDPNNKTFCVLTKVWRDIQLAAREGTDTDKIVDLIAADDVHPQLLPVISKFKRCPGESYVIRSNSSPNATIGHYSLCLSSYTQASSPLRRYNDVVLQRLLHTFICGTPVQYSPREIDILCLQFEKSNKMAKDYEQKYEMISFALNSKKESVPKLAFIVSADSDGDSFRVSFPFDKNIFPGSLPIMYRDLQLEDQPFHDKAKNCMVLKWRRRIYSFKSTHIHEELKRPLDCGPCTKLPLATWKAIIQAIDEENWHKAKSLIMTAEEKQLEKPKMFSESGGMVQVENTLCTAEQYHYVDLSVNLQPGDTLKIQMTSEIKRAYPTPTVQLLCIKPSFEVCVDHSHSPITCFSKYAFLPSKSNYRDTSDYINVWKPLCEMESAETAVSESESIIIADLTVNFYKNQRDELRGIFTLPLSYIKKWAIECDLAKCLLCIRKRGLKLTSTLDHCQDVDPGNFTWVAHGVTYKLEEPEKSTNKPKKVHFYIKHLPMKDIPECVFQSDKTFTVELIPKLLPDIRKENAVVNIESACNLVKQIALGQRIPKEAVQHSLPRAQIIRRDPPKGLPKLNDSQYDALEKALNHNFTLIQGPPGTGKTVVGVYIVYWFLQQNSKINKKFTDPKDKNKKEVILYCGPSNKSVDVVAEYLLKFGSDLKPLRVYSQQVEMLDYPFPGGTLQFSHKSSRQEHSKPELRDITLHHRMRQDQNPFSAEIKEFDRKIQCALEKKGKELTDEQVEVYRKILRSARKYELEHHDIILCTCTTSSSPSLTKTVSARQILIDECAMATEPQAIVPLVCNNPEKHDDICKFPSMEYYDGLLKTEVEHPSSVLLVDNRPKPIVFGDIKGKEISLVVSTAKGNENSKANIEERDIVVKIAKKLVEKGVKQQSIVILSPYNAQVSEVRAYLQGIKLSEITVTTITKSQGSEWRYVIISTVRSLPSEEIEHEPNRAWLSKHVGFVGDPNQINVGITRAKEGLCIVGNQELLNCSPAWRQLLNFYKTKSSVTDANNICVRSVR
ncbi:helicase with zinc finger domain 2 isoform X2 [Lampris incognitus]|uniref:helicase with zinc finger domain 2 isoform X2 n=1 Tax=Lampris incognitus TaxID=2546036 RepID=UPI0024B6145A|nr:helicase with zinc finger domain 2 isoform X2 [Lampris incognitus]